MLRIAVAATALLGSAWAAQAEFDATDSNIVYSGRFLMQPGNVSFVWSGSTISTTFTGTSIAVMMRDPHGQYDVIIDDQKSFQPFVPKSPTPAMLYVASQLKDGKHSFVLRRRTEGFSNAFGVGTASISKFYLDDGNVLLPTKAPNAASGRRIEVIGDSITCGSGVLGRSPDCDFSFDTEDFFSTYAAIAADRFHAQIHAVCWSGKGLVKNYNETCQLCPNAMPAYYPFILDNYEDESSKWNFSAFQPQAVIINLGVNDFDPANPEPVSEANFTAGYVKLINDLRTVYYNKDIHLFLACRHAAELSGPCDLVKAIVANASDERVHYVDLSWKDEPESSLGCGNHPGVLGHLKMADLLVASMGSVIGWSVEHPSTHIEAYSIVMLAAFFLVGLGGHVWGCVIRKPTKDKGLLLEQV